jgi:hypothetical protein
VVMLLSPSARSSAPLSWLVCTVRCARWPTILQQKTFMANATLTNSCHFATCAHTSTYSLSLRAARNCLCTRTATSAEDLSTGRLERIHTARKHPYCRSPLINLWQGTTRNDLAVVRYQVPPHAVAIDTRIGSDRHPECRVYNCVPLPMSALARRSIVALYGAWTISRTGTVARFLGSESSSTIAYIGGLS